MTLKWMKVVPPMYQRISTATEELKRAKKCAIANKSSLWEVIYVDVQGVSYTSLEIVHKKKYFTLISFLKPSSTND